jgi:ATP-dependent exoDNAse (exonuclease V) beta subunit
MQSIYKFRDRGCACLSGNNASASADPVECLTLPGNFRSQAGLVDWVNAFRDGRPATLA